MNAESAPHNRLLAALPSSEWAALRNDARYVSLPIGHTMRTPGTPVDSVFFPESGVISFIDALADGHHVEVAAIGREGVVGVGTVLEIGVVPFWQLVQVASTGYELPADRFVHLFHHSEPLRRLTMQYIGRLMVQLAHSASCNRFHSNRERLARWLLVLVAKSGQRSLELTHELIAQMVGGPRHAVTAALNELRESGVITYVPGRVEVIDEARLIAAACDCYRGHELEISNEGRRGAANG